MGIESSSSSTQPFQAELPIDIVPRQSCDTFLVRAQAEMCSSICGHAIGLVATLAASTSAR
jgi:hypothetical protein